ncbi:MAG: cell wall hydrolase [Caulobacteraceae bacterium]|nr:cell wall hydrolase [Caulobacteraceae bacterium]
MTTLSPPDRWVRPRPRAGGLVAAGLVGAGVAILAAPIVAANWTRLSPSPASRWIGRQPSRRTPPPERVGAPGTGAGLSAAGPPASPSASLAAAAAFAQNAAVPISAAPNPPSAPFHLGAATTQDRTRSIDCLAAAIYYEAASESLRGQQAVAQVVVNRLAAPRFPKTVCGVVFQGAARESGCQFTFTCDGSLNRAPSPQGWARARDVATAALGGYVETSVGRATHYHTLWVRPQWSAQLLKVAVIGAHIFYAGGLASDGEGASSPDVDPLMHGRGADPQSADFEAAEPLAVIATVPQASPFRPAATPATRFDDVALTAPASPRFALVQQRRPSVSERRLPVPQGW